jgi:hypothetical protein
VFPSTAAANGFQLAFGLQGTSYAVMLPGTSLTFTMDGKQYTLPDIPPYNVGGGGCSVSVLDQFSCVNRWVIAPKTDQEREALASLVRLLSGSREVYVTMMGGPGTNRFSIQLTEPQLDVIRRVLDEYSRY